MSPNVSAMKRIKAYCEDLEIEFGNIEKTWLEKNLESRKIEKDDR